MIENPTPWDKRMRCDLKGNREDTVASLRQPSKRSLAVIIHETPTWTMGKKMEMGRLQQLLIEGRGSIQRLLSYAIDDPLQCSGYAIMP